MSKRSVLVFSLLVALLAFSAVSYAVSDSYRVTIALFPVNQIELQPGEDFDMIFVWDDVNWTLKTPEAVSHTLRWATNIADQKITVGLNSDLPEHLILKLNNIPLTGAGFDLVNPVDLTSGARTKSLRYTVFGDLRVTPGIYKRTITYTLTSI